MPHAAQAAIFNIGGSPLVGLIILALIVGIVVYFALKLLDFATFIDGKFKEFAKWLIYVVAVLIVLNRALEVFFGVSLGI